MAAEADIPVSQKNPFAVGFIQSTAKRRNMPAPDNWLSGRLMKAGSQGSTTPYPSSPGTGRLLSMKGITFNNVRLTQLDIRVNRNILGSVDEAASWFRINIVGKLNKKAANRLMTGPASETRLRQKLFLSKP